MEEIIHANSELEFDRAIKTGVSLVDFWATWCHPCQMQAPILYDFKEEVGDKVNVIKVDVDQLPSLAYKYGINSIPALLVFKDGELKEKTAGLTSKAGLSDMVIKYL